ncbi:ubiquitin carboxyl-terminal hydrolase 48-like [Actinia tenebrosa]|uniref:Ubiquitin carboxyl-terminal hydrolase 14 n=1 Tax=Actinia tenebrosa TaxID=6105 RepID=A0A6P8HW37_ACTTE|nr:ubiquitin carboxyl-terminal hydrolase 48-like [Actinia tenebrosa]
MNEILKDDINDEKNAPVYELTAVLMHHGTSAYSGHYVAHIKDKETNTWYKFNDEDIEKMQNKLKLSGEDETSNEPGEKPAKRPKCSKGYHTSRNAYMLVYTRKTDEDMPKPVVEVPEHLQELVAKDNSKFEEWITEMNRMKDDMVSKGKNLQAEVQSVLQMLPAVGDNYEWISSEWLRIWLNDRIEVKPPIDHSSLLCSHGKLNPEKVPNAKRISTNAADWFYAKFGGFPRLQRDSLCFDCVKSVCSQIRFKFRLAEDDKAIKAILKTKVVPQRVGNWFWIGKSSLFSWKKLATLADNAKNTGRNPLDESGMINNAPIQQATERDTCISTNGSPVNTSRKRKNKSNTCEEDDSLSKEDGLKDLSAVKTMNMDTDSCTGTNNRGVGSCQMDESTSMEDGSRMNESSEEEEEDLMKFNEDLMCEHGNLSANATCRKLIQESIWQRLLYYFDSAREFPEDHPICQQCQVESEDERKIQELNKARATEERVALSNLYYNKHRPDLHNNDEEHSKLCVYAVSNSFLDRWRSFLRNCFKCPRPDSISNEDLLCPHQRFMFNPELRDEDGAREVFSYLFKNEWDLISTKYPYDEIITVTKETTEDKEKPSFITSPEICEDCHASRMLEKARSFENYRHATIFVRKITDEHDPNEIQRRFDEEVTDPDSPQDPDYSSSDNKQKSSSENSKRRSSRHRKQRGEINLTVNSNQTLRDIKLELMKSFSVMPMDQHLSLKSTPLTDDAATLSRLGVRPGCLLMLKLDQPQGGGHPETLLAASTAPEKGFQGTVLLGH